MLPTFYIKIPDFSTFNLRINKKRTKLSMELTNCSYFPVVIRAGGGFFALQGDLIPFVFIPILFRFHTVSRKRRKQDL
jgi:hypothetical protein